MFGRAAPARGTVTLSAGCRRAHGALSLYSNLGDPETGIRDCVLVRCFKTVSFGRLDPSTQQIAREKLGGIPRSQT